MAKYLQAVDWIIDQIKKQKLAESDKIMPEIQISEALGISRQTVRKAIGYLENQGILRSVQGSGTYVAQLPVSIFPKNTSNIITVVTTCMNSYIFPDKIKGIYETLSKAGYMMNLMTTNNRVEEEHLVLSSLLEKDLAGVILETSQGTLPRVDEDIICQLVKKFPVIHMDSWYDNAPIPHVAVDDKKGGCIAVRHLLESGHRKILYIGKMDDRQGLLRYEGYLSALKEYQLLSQTPAALWYTNDLPPEIFFHLMQDKILEHLGECTAIFCHNDLLTPALLEFLEKHGFNVPRDISIVGFDDSPLAKQYDFLTSVRHPSVELGAKTAENLLKMIENPNFDGTYLFEPTLTKRRSVRTLMED